MIKEKNTGFGVKRMVVIGALFFLAQNLLMAGNNLTRVLDLKGKWKFSIGEEDEWKSESFDDSNWESIEVPKAWEEQGFNGYNGYATYRKKFTVSSANKDLMLYMVLGYVDDVDEAYINGHKIGGTGSFPPDYETAYNAERKYYIPADILHFDGTNVLTVVVYDSYQYGGIVSGEVGVYAGKSEMKLDVNLQGKWNFHTGDNFTWKDFGFDDVTWDELFVPGKWEDQHYRDYDGYAWYRKKFVYKSNLPDDEKMVLVLGKIDDLDQVYINGVLVGSTGGLTKKTNERLPTDQQYQAFRGYYLPAGVLKKNKENIIAVRVYDAWGDGGIYEGPVGLISQTKYIAYWRNNKYLFK
jgi:sialate O-acetylesterase